MSVFIAFDAAILASTIFRSSLMSLTSSIPREAINPTSAVIGRIMEVDTKNDTTSRAPTTAAEILNGLSIQSFVDEALSFEGQPYCWPTAENRYSGKGLPNAMYDNCHDCSGTITDALYKSSEGKVDWRATHNAQKLHDVCEETKDPGLGDIVFYGKPGHISHVMLYVDHHDGVVFGASGGDHLTTSPKAALDKNAKVCYKASVFYRSDFVSFGRLNFS